MTTRLIMTSSAVLMGLAGILLSFLPNELAAYLPGSQAIVFQILGALYFGFAMVNWMSKGNLIGGIYNRPLAIGNLSHFLIASLALLKVAMKNPSPGIIAMAVVYSMFAASFSYILFTHPVKESKAE